MSDDYISLGGSDDLTLGTGDSISLGVDSGAGQDVSPDVRAENATDDEKIEAMEGQAWSEIDGFAQDRERAKRQSRAMMDDAYYLVYVFNSFDQRQSFKDAIGYTESEDNETGDILYGVFLDGLQLAEALGIRGKITDDPVVRSPSIHTWLQRVSTKLDEDYD